MPSAIIAMCRVFCQNKKKTRETWDTSQIYSDSNKKLFQEIEHFIIKFTRIAIYLRISDTPSKSSFIAIFKRNPSILHSLCRIDFKFN